MLCLRRLLAAVAVLALPAAGMTLPDTHHHEVGKEWSDYVSKQGSGQAILDRFAPGARVCMFGKCGGIEIVHQYENSLDMLQVQMGKEQAVIKDGFVASRWFDVARHGGCEKHWSGNYMAYVNKDGRYTEYHEWADEDVVRDFEWMMKNCKKTHLEQDL